MVHVAETFMIIAHIYLNTPTKWGKISTLACGWPCWIWIIFRNYKIITEIIFVISTNGSPQNG